MNEFEKDLAYINRNGKRWYEQEQNKKLTSIVIKMWLGHYRKSHIDAHNFRIEVINNPILP